MYIDYIQLEELQRILNNFAKSAAILEEAGIAVPEEAPKIVQSKFTEHIDDEEEYEYILKKVPRSLINRARRATPGLIPAAEFLENFNGSVGASSASVQTNSHRRRQLANGYREYEFPEAGSSGRSSAISHQHYKSKSDLQMGFDIIDKIRKFLNFGTNSVENESIDSNRKRRPEPVSNENFTSQIKYRRVDNKFPKVITRPFEGDVEFPSCSRDNSANQNFIFDRETSREFGRFTPNMSQQGKCQKKAETVQNHRRNSIFNQPQSLRKKVTNTPFADIEFSDDEDCEIVGSINLNDIKSGCSKARGSSYSDVCETFEQSNKIQREARPAKFCNIPISNVDQLIGKMGNSSLQQKKLSSFRSPPPPLIEARTGGIFELKLMPGLHSIRRQNGYPNNDNIERYRGCLYNDQIVGAMGGSGDVKKQSVFSSHQKTSKMNGNIISPKVKRLTSAWRPRSIIAQEQQTKDREQYSELLHRMVPRLYAPEEPSLKGRRSFIQQQQPKYQSSPKPTATICLTDEEDDENHDDVIITGVDDPANVAIINDDDISEVIDLAEDERNISECRKLNTFGTYHYDLKNQAAEKQNELPYVKPVNSLQERFDLEPVFKKEWLQNFKSRHEIKHKENSQRVQEATKEAEECAIERKRIEREVQAGFRQLQIVDPDLVALDEFSVSEDSETESEEGEPEVIEFTQKQQELIRFSISGPRNEVLITKFNMNITRRDIETLMNLNWLNDEVINYYMNLLIDRSDKRHQKEGLPKVYAMNTFFVPRLTDGGHAAVRRWTRKVNIFDYDVIPVPVHVGGVHWCMAIIHLKNKTIKYYDSMATPNPRVLAALEKYLQDESMDKLKKPFDTSQFDIDSVRDVPRQMNGSDCGVFSCMFAEYVTRNREITFTQEHMPYFRQKMILEITQGELLQ